MGNYPPDRNPVGGSDPLVETARKRKLGKAKRRTVKDSTDMRAAEWMTAEQAAKHLGCESVKAFEEIASREGVPKHHLSARVPRYNRAELDAWLMTREGAVPRQCA